MSSDCTAPEIADPHMAIIASVLFRAGYDAGAAANRRVGSAAAMLNDKIRSGETDLGRLERYLDDFFGRPVADVALFAPVLPRFAIQGLPAKSQAQAHSGVTILPLQEQIGIHK